MSTGSHRPDEHARIEEVLAEADPVAEDCALRERARRDRPTRRRPSRRSLRSSRTSTETRDGLPDAGRAGDTDHEGPSRARVHRADDRLSLRLATFHEADSASEGLPIACDDGRGEIARNRSLSSPGRRSLTTSECACVVGGCTGAPSGDAPSPRVASPRSRREAVAGDRRRCGSRRTPRPRAASRARLGCDA